MSLQDPDLRRGPTTGHMRVLTLPSGGTVEIPLPSAKTTKMVVKPPSGALRGAETGSALVPVMLGVIVGAVIGGAVVWMVTRS